jgi:hypothetical protein
MLTRHANPWFGAIVMASTIIGCSSSSDKTGPDAFVLQPGVENSSQAYMGTPDADESAFWVAVRDADDSGRATAISKLVADVGKDPSNGYSEFLIGASYFMPPNTVLAALAAGTPPPQSQPDPAAVPYLMEAPTHLMDPFYLGFDGGLLGALELATGNPAGGPTFAAAQANNHAATDFITVIGDLQMQNAAKALTDMYTLFDFCNGAALDQGGADAAAYVTKQNAGTLVHRECYSGYYAPHGSSGEMLILADLEALNGNTSAANAYYAALQNTTDYSTWALMPLVERRVNGTQPADVATLGAIASTCATCHTNTLQ